MKKEVNIIEEILNREKETGLSMVQELLLKITKESNDAKEVISKRTLTDTSADSFEEVSEYVESLKDMGYIEEKYNNELIVTLEGEAKLEEIG